MDVYLKSLRDKLRNLKNQTSVTFVIGNESCDLDSVVSAISYGYYLHSKEQSNGVIIPLLQVSKDDLPLRTEVLFCLQQLNLSVFDIPLIDEVDFNGLRILKEMKIKIVLVDHNNIFDESLESECLVEIIDHHQLGKKYSEEKVRLTVQAVGSCSTLVMDRIWKEYPTFKDYHVLMLCRFTIITDTVNFSEVAKKTTDKDIEIIERLESELNLQLDQRIIDFKLISKAKQDTKDLTVIQCLRKDLKMVRGNAESQDIAVASHMELGETLINRKDFEAEVRSFLKLQHCSLLIVMGLEIHESEQSHEQNIRRDILIIPANESLGQKIFFGLKETPELHVSEKQIAIDNAVLLEQEDVSYSRKKLIPIIQRILTT